MPLSPRYFLISGGDIMDITLLKILIQEEKYPTFSDEQLEQLATAYDSVYQLAYVCCMMKSETASIKVGPIEIENDAAMWINLANMYLQQYKDEQNSKGNVSSSLTGKVMLRADE